MKDEKVKGKGEQASNHLSYHNFTRRISFDSILLALLIISTFMKILIPPIPIPFTMQLLVALIIALITQKLDGILIFATYIFLGLIGLPIFANGGGLGYVYSPTFGFILGFILMDLAMFLTRPFLIRTRMNKYLKDFISSLIGLLVLYLAGAGYAYLIFNIHLNEGLTMVNILGMTVLPFILFDILKCVIASLISSRLSYMFKR